MQKFLQLLWEHRALILRLLAALLAGGGVVDGVTAVQQAPEGAMMAPEDAGVVGLWGLGSVVSFVLSFLGTQGGVAAVDSAMAGLFRVIRSKSPDPNVRLVAGVTLSSACIEISAGNPAAIALAEQWRAKFLEGPEPAPIVTTKVTFP